MTGYDPSLFKTCAELPFVRRHRPCLSSNTAVAAARGNTYTVDPSSVCLSAQRGVSEIVATLSRDKHPNDTPLKLFVRCYARDLLRITIDDATPLKHDRHVPDGVLDTDLENAPVAIDPSSFVVDQSTQTATLSLPSVACRLKFSPFLLHIDRVSSEGDSRHTVVAVNSGNRLYYDAFTEEEPETFAGFRDVRKRGAESVGIDVSFPVATHLHGLPERTVAFALPDTITSDGGHEKSLSEPYRLYNIDMPFYEVNSPTCLYGSIPFLYARSPESSVGLFWHNTSETYVDVSSSSPSSAQPENGTASGKNTHWYSETGRVDMFVLPGPSPKQVYEQYLRLTGRPAKQPHFALGYHQCRYSYMSEEDVRAVDNGFDEHRIPYDVMWLDIDHTDGKQYFTWNYDTFPNPTQLRMDLQDKGRQMVTIIDPHVKVTDPSYFLHQIASSQRLYIRKGPSTEKSDEAGSASAEKDLVSSCWPGKSSWLDFNDEKPRQVWADQFTTETYPHFGHGMYVWNDMNEPSTFEGPERTLPKDALHHNGTTEHRNVHNVYGHSMVRATYAGLSRFYESDRVFVLTRAFHAGTQRYAAVWTGDNTADWDHLQCSVRMLLTLSLCGVALCGADVGGFFGDPAPELLARWYQVGAFQPFFRGHSMTGTKRREPWLFGEPYLSVIRAAVRARYKFMPFWITLFEMLNRAKLEDKDKDAEDEQCVVVSPPMRPLWWQSADVAVDDETCQSSWMVGDSLFVAPVMKSSSSHAICFPTLQNNGADEQWSWYDLFNPEAPGIAVSSRDVAYTDVPLERLFVFQRPGSVIPMTTSATAEKCTNSTTAFSGGLSLSIGLDINKSAVGDVYLDDVDAMLQIHVRDGAVSSRGASDDGGGRSKIGLASVTIYGVSTEITQVSVDGRELAFTYSAKARSMSVDGVDVGVDQGWRLTFQ